MLRPTKCLISSGFPESASVTPSIVATEIFVLAHINPNGACAVEILIAHKAKWKAAVR
jgi:hypothetical protein